MTVSLDIYFIRHIFQCTNLNTKYVMIFSSNYQELRFKENNKDSKM